MSANVQSNQAPIADLNTTPLIDVMLVLLIMFIITMPIGTHAVKVDLPGTEIDQVPVNDTKNIIGISGNGIIFWNGRAVDRAMLRTLLAQAQAKVIEPQLLFDPAAEARYEIVDTVLSDIKRSGARKLAFVSTERFSRF